MSNSNILKYEHSIDDKDKLHLTLTNGHGYAFIHILKSVIEDQINYNRGKWQKQNGYVQISVVFQRWHTFSVYNLVM